MLKEAIQSGKKLPIDIKAYEAKVKAAEYLRLSYKPTGISYTQGDAPDGKIIHKMECEEKEDWRIRTSQTPTRHYVATVINKYNSAVFRNEPTREESGIVETLYSDADGFGSPLNTLMRNALKSAQIDGASYLLADSTASDTQILTIAQKNSSGVRPYIRLLKVDNILHIEEIENTITEAIVLLVDENGKTFARYMDDTDFIDMILDEKKMIVKDMSATYSHGYASIPLVQIQPFDIPQSQLPADSQRTIVNILSLLQQEITDHTFTKHILSGVRIPQDEDGAKQKITYGSKRMIVLEDSGAKLDTIGSDVSQADSLRKQVELEETNLYYAAGFGRPNVEPTALSGVSRLIAMEDFFISCDALKNAIEVAENKILALISSKESGEVTQTAYIGKYVADDVGEDLQKLRDLLALPLPNTFKKLAIKDYINKFYNVSDEDMRMIEQELLANEPVNP